MWGKKYEQYDLRKHFAIQENEHQNIGMRRDENIVNISYQ